MLVFVLSLTGAFLLLLFVVSYLLSLRRTYSIRGKHVLVSLTGRINRAAIGVTAVAFFFQITGGSSGIGKELAAEAIRRGAEAVTIVARTEVDTQSTCKLACVHNSCPRKHNL